MSFENDYKAFMKALFLKDYKEAENILAISDTKTKFILSAINDFGDMRVRTIVENFRSVGLKRSLEKVFDEQKNLCLTSNYQNSANSEKIILVHQKNKIKNKLYHLSGSSFSNENISKNEYEYLINKKSNKVSA